jgi:hypothetical protein
VVTPLVGALIISLFGFNALFMISAVLMLLAVVTIGAGHKSIEEPIADVRLQQALELVVKHKSVSAAYFGQGADAAFHTVFWPIFLFVAFKEVLAVGSVYSGAILLTAMIALFVGFWIDKRGVRETVSLGTIVVSVTWLARAVFTSVGAFVLIDSTSGIAKKLLNISLDGLSYKKAAESDMSMAILFREINLAIGYLVAVTGSAIMFIVDPSLRGVLLLAAVFTLTPLIAVIRKRI